MVDTPGIDLIFGAYFPELTPFDLIFLLSQRVERILKTHRLNVDEA